MKKEAICLRCGEWKSAPYARCKQCGYVPKTDSEDELKSVFLSLGRFSDGEDQAKYQMELENVRRTIAAGGEVVYDKQEISRLSQQRDSFRSISAVSAWKAVLRFFLPAVLLLLGLVVLIVLLRMIR